MRTALLLTGAIALAPHAATAQVVAGATFTFTGLATANGWTNHSGTGTFINSNGSVATLSQGAGSREDINMSFAPFALTDTMYASFTLNVPSGNPVNPPTGLYFFHFKDTGTSNFRSRTGVLGPSGGGDYRLAINAAASDLTLGGIWPTDLAFNTDYQVVINWNAATGQSKLWLNPLAETDPSVSHTGALLATPISSIALRQAIDYTGLITVDNIAVGRTFDDVLGAAPVYYTVGAGCASSVGIATNRSSALAEIGKPWVIDIGNVPTPEVALLIIGSANTPPIDLTFLGATGCNGHVTTDVLTQFAFGAANAVPYTIGVPLDPQFIALPLFTQAVVFEVAINPAQFVVSNAARAEIGS